MDRIGMIDEYREILLDQLSLVYNRCNSAVGRKMNNGDFFNIQDRNECDMEIAILEQVLGELHILLHTSTSRYDWNAFPIQAAPRFRIFGGFFLNDDEWMSLKDELESGLKNELLSLIKPLKGVHRKTIMLLLSAICEGVQTLLIK